MITEQLCINGEYRAASCGKTGKAVNPATGEQFGEFAWDEGEDTAAALDAAAGALPDWQARSGRERSIVLRQVAAAIRDNRESLAQLLTTEHGKALKESYGELEASALHFEWYAEEAQRIEGRWLTPAAAGKRHLVMQQPVGVVAAIMPFNFPVLLWARKVAPAMGAGCTVVAKPAGSTALVSAAANRLCHDVGLPAGVHNFVTGKSSAIAATILDDQRLAKLTFTGSTEVGVQLQQLAAKNLIRTSMELGGNAPAVVFDDVDLDFAAAKVAGGKFRNIGQSCIAVNRIFVQRSIHDAFVDVLAQKITALKTGNGLDEDVDMGAMIDAAAIEKVESHVADALDKGGKLVAGGTRLADGAMAAGNFFAPTLITNTSRDMLFADDETFGPVAFVQAFDTEEEVIGKANDTQYGLAAYVLTRDLDRALRVCEAIRAGTVALNDDVPSNTIAPFGGFKMSGLGRECSTEGIEAFLETKHVSIGI